MRDSAKDKENIDWYSRDMLMLIAKYWVDQYEKAKEDAETISKYHIATIDHALELQSENAMMRECLEWYANPDTYKWHQDEDDPLEMPWTDILDDDGKCARECLSKLGGADDAKPSQSEG